MFNIIALYVSLVACGDTGHGGEAEPYQVPGISPRNPL